MVYVELPSICFRDDKPTNNVDKLQEIEAQGMCLRNVTFDVLGKFGHSR